MKVYHSNLLDAKINLSLRHVYFWRGPFSQWHMTCSSFMDEELNVRFCCAEQAMMAHKAHVFEDEEVYDKVLATKNAREQKALGRLIKNFDGGVWDKVKYDIVRDISFYKFSQNDSLKDLLLTTDGYELVEASPMDKIWGVGLAEEDPKIYDKFNWQGQNLLGKALMDARERIIKHL